MHRWSYFIPKNTILIKCQLHVNYKFQLNHILPTKDLNYFPIS